MKKVIVLVVIAVAGAFAYQQFTHSQFGSGSLTPEERMVQSFDERIDAAARQIAQAGRTAGVSGMDSTSDVEAALQELERIESEIQSLKKKAGAEEIRRECDRLLSKVEATRR